MMFEHHTEAFAVVENWLGRTTDKSAGRVSQISERLDELARDGWELVSMTPMPVVGSLRRSSERRTLTVGVFKRPVGHAQRSSPAALVRDEGPKSASPIPGVHSKRRKMVSA